MDPLAGKYPSYSPYIYTFNNPIIYNDPTGMEGEKVDDWYKDECGNIRYNKDLSLMNSKMILKENEQYLGNTYTETTNNGTNFYRQDGSILFGCHADAVKYMEWSTFKDGNKHGKQKEQYGFVMGKKILVTPDYGFDDKYTYLIMKDYRSKGNGPTNSSPWDYGYDVADGQFYDPVSSKLMAFSSTVHTHPAGPKDGNKPSGADLSFGRRFHGSRFGFVLGLGNNTLYRYNGSGSWQALTTIDELKSGKKFIIHEK